MATSCPQTKLEAGVLRFHSADDVAVQWLENALIHNNISANRKPPWQIHDTREYAAALFCGVDMPSQPLTWSISPRHDMLKMS